MKKFLRKLLVCGIILVATAVILNINVTTRQGINYQVRTLRIPLYLKLLDFFDRHYNYKQLLREVISGSAAEEERAMKVLEWTFYNVRRVPEGFPVIDDHVWNIIVRGYGVDDQFQDVFTTLCNYCGLRSFFYVIKPQNGKPKKPISFVQIKGRWCGFDAYHGVYFSNREGELASVDDLRKGNWQTHSISKGDIPAAYYTDYFGSLGSIDYQNWKLHRAAIQSPFRRFISLIKNNR